MSALSSSVLETLHFLLLMSLPAHSICSDQTQDKLTCTGTCKFEKLADLLFHMTNFQKPQFDSQAEMPSLEMSVQVLILQK